MCLQYLGRRCIQKDDCKEMRRPLNFQSQSGPEKPYKIYNNSCILECPANYMNNDTHCIPCQGNVHSLTSVFINFNFPNKFPAQPKLGPTSEVPENQTGHICGRLKQYDYTKLLLVIVLILVSGLHFRVN